MTTPKELALAVADESWGSAESGKGMMFDAVEAALNAFAQAHADEFRRLAEIRGEPTDDRFYLGMSQGFRYAYEQAAQMVERLGGSGAL